MTFRAFSYKILLFIQLGWIYLTSYKYFMGLQTQRRTKSSKKRRASHFALTKVNLIECPHCKTMILPHHACPKCGYYKGKQVVKIETALDKKNRKKNKKTS